MMQKRGGRLKPCCRRRLALLLILLGIMLAIGGIAALMMMNAARAPLSESSSATEETTDTTQAAAVNTETVSEPEEAPVTQPTEEPAETPAEEMPVVDAPIHFEGVLSLPEGHSFMIANGSDQVTGDLPDFHALFEITAEAGVNPKTNEASDDLRIVTKAIPDREMSIAVLVSAEGDVITGSTPDTLAGVQWTLTYTGGEFKKSARSIDIDGGITSLTAEDFNVKFAGKGDYAEIEFYGPLGTRYYAVLIYDDSYCTLILP